MPFAAAAVLGGSSLIGSLIGANASSNAADTTAASARRAAALQAGEFGLTQQNLLPFLQTGTTANQVLSSNYLGVDGPTGTFNPNAPFLQSPLSRMGPPPSYNMPGFTAGMYQHSPGYNAALQGGVEALQNAGTTTTGALSGNTLKALQGYGTQAANQDYQQAYQNYATNYSNQFTGNNANFWNQYNAGNQQNQNIFNWLSQLGGGGQSAAAGLGGLGATAAGNAGNALIGAGSANAAGMLGVGNAFSGGLNSLSTMLARPNSDSSLIAALMAGGGGGSGFTYPAASQPGGTFQYPGT